jgi:hypothetical protein
MKTTQNYVTLNINNLHIKHNRTTSKQDSVLTDTIHTTIQEATEYYKHKIPIKN